VIDTAMPARAKTVLYVDDDEGAAQLMELLLAQRGHHMLHATSVEAGRKLLGAADVLLADVELADGSGLDLLTAGRPSRLERAYVVSGHSNLARAAKTAGFDATFTKPVDVDELLRLIEV
jgi:DNA-binding NtrC family response regulator